MQHISEKHVTNRNGVQLAELAREHGVSRRDFVEFLKDKQRVKKFFDMELMPWFQKIKKAAEKAHINCHYVEVEVDYKITHREAVLLGGPQTHSKHDIFKMGKKYQLLNNKKATEIIILLTNCSTFGDARKFGRENDLDFTTPHVPFAIGEKFPNLNYELGVENLIISETTACNFKDSWYLCSVAWHYGARDSRMVNTGNMNIPGTCFALRKKQ